MSTVGVDPVFRSGTGDLRRTTKRTTKVKTALYASARAEEGRGDGGLGGGILLITHPIVFRPLTLGPNAS